jgi:hypothetical protein
MNCRAVLCEVNIGLSECPDAIGWTGGCQSHLVEVKISRADFRADKEKPFRKIPTDGMGMYRWFMTPPGLLDLDDISDGWGLLEVHKRSVWTLRKAIPQPQYNSHAEISILVQNLAYAEICAPKRLQEWFNDPSTPVGNTRLLRREIGRRQRQLDLDRVCNHRDFSRYEETKLWPAQCGVPVASRFSQCSEHGGRTRGERPPKALVAPMYSQRKESAKPDAHLGAVEQ